MSLFDSNKNRVMQEIIAEKNHTKVPSSLWTLNISSVSKIIWGYILSRPNYEISSIKDLSNILNIHRSTVSTSLQELKNENMVYLIKVGSNLSVCLVEPSKWKNAPVNFNKRAIEDLKIHTEEMLSIENEDLYE